MNNNFLGAGALISSLLLAPVVHGEITGDDISLIPQIGYYYFDSDRDLDAATTLGLGLGLHFSPSWVMEFTYTTLETDHKYIDSNTDYEYDHYHVDGLYFFNAKDRFQPYLVAGVGNASIDFQGTDNDETLVNAGAGVLYQMSSNWALRSDLRALKSLDYETTDAALTISLSYRFGDGAAYVIDTDGDGVGDKKDRCPDSPAGREVNQFGCPLDGDNDGVVDHMDQCKNTPANIKVDVQGCALDSDGDGVPNYKDECPETKANFKVDQKGCAVDSDADGVLNSLDQCPDTSEGAKVDGVGCYLMLTEKVSVRLDINFASGSSLTTPDHYPEIEKIARFMQEYPLTHVTIEGHSDSSGSDSFNKTLSQRRADAVAKELVDRFNIDAERVKAIGYGEERPIASNDSPEGRSKNRRVVAVVETSVSKRAR